MEELVFFAVQPTVRSSCNFFSIIIGSSSADARLSDKMKAFDEPLKPSSAPNWRIIGRSILSPPRYWDKRAAYLVDLSGKGEFINGGLEALTSRKFEKVLGLGKARKHR